MEENLHKSEQMEMGLDLIQIVNCEAGVPNFQMVWSEQSCRGSQIHFYLISGPEISFDWQPIFNPLPKLYFLHKILLPWHCLYLWFLYQFFKKHQIKLASLIIGKHAIVKALHH